MAKVFIGMPVYNGSRFIRESIDSIRNQTYTDWELFISDDCSSDDTGTICLDYVKMDTRITYHRRQKNFGLFANFGFVLEKANGDYFMWQAQDDVREKEYIETCVNYLQSHPDFGFATTTLTLIDSLGRTVAKEPDLALLSGKPSTRGVLRYVLQPEILGKCNLLYGIYRTQVARIVSKAYPQRNVWGQDYMFALALVSRFPVYIKPQSLFKKRLGGYSSPKTLEKKGSLDTVMKSFAGNAKNYMFPFLRFKPYFKGHMEALEDTPYKAVAAVALFARLPRSFFIFIKSKIKKFL